MKQQRKTPDGVLSLAGETQSGADTAGALPARIARYSKAKARSLDMANYARTADHVKEAQKLDRCGNYLHFRHYYTVDKVRLHSAQFCKKHLLCPLCAIRRGAKTLKAYLDKLIVVQGERPALRPYLVTFTVKNGPDLWERFRHLRSNYQRLCKMRSLGRGVSEVEKAEGAVWSYEVTNKGKGWHPHLHAVWLCESAPDQAKLRAEWEARTGDSFMVDVRPIEQEPVQGFLEVFKYALKFSELELADNLEAYDVLKGERLVASLGCFRGVEVPEELTDEPLDDLPFVDLFYRYLPAGYSLQAASQA